MSFIELKDASKIYQMGEVEIKALDQMSFQIEKGEFVVVLGASQSLFRQCHHRRQEYRRL